MGAVLWMVGFVVLLSVLCAALWLRMRAHVYMAWWSGALMSLAIGGALVGTEAMAYGLYGISMLLAMQALVTRFGRRLQVHWLALSVGLYVVTLPVAGLAGHWQGVRVLALAGATVLLGVHALNAVWHLPARHGGDRVVRWGYLLGVLVALAMPWAAVPHAGAIPWAGALLLTFAFGLCVWKDKVGNGEARSRTVLARRQVLNRVQMEEACGRFPHAQGIHVLVVCEADLRSPHAPAGSTAYAALMRRFADLLHSRVREGDWVAELGGGAFVLALRHIDMASAQSLVQRIYADMQQRWAKPDGGTPMAVANFGLAMVREADTLTVAMHRAEVLMLQAKDRTLDGIGVDEVATEAA